MAGGRVPKSLDRASDRTIAREAKKIRMVDSEPCDPPPFPKIMPDGLEWPDHTVFWWESWISDPLTEDYRMSDWLDLMDCAVIHGRLWHGEVKAASELRLRMARHGATREDRARLRITFANADESERRAQAGAAGLPSNTDSETSAKVRRAGLRAVSQ